jgi:hypothetical protein
VKGQIIGRFHCYDCGNAARNWRDAMNTGNARNARFLLAVLRSAKAPTLKH